MTKRNRRLEPTMMKWTVSVSLALLAAQDAVVDAHQAPSTVSA